MTCAKCLDDIQAKARAPWLAAGVPLDSIAAWARFEPESAAAFLRQGFVPAEAVAWSAHGFTSDDFSDWASAGFTSTEAVAYAALDEPFEWKHLGVEAADAATWEERDFDPDTSEPWRLAGFGPKAAYRLRELGLTPSALAEWRQADLKFEEIRMAMLLGYSIQDAISFRSSGWPAGESTDDWEGVPVSHRHVWRSAVGDFRRVCWWYKHIDPTTLDPRDRDSLEHDWFYEPVVGLALEEVIAWHLAGASPNEDHPNFFKLFRDAGYAPDEAVPLLALIEELDGDLDQGDFVRLKAYRLAGIPLDLDTLRRWWPLDPPVVLDAIDRGFTSAVEYGDLQDLDIPAEEAMRIRGAVDDPTLVREVWAGRESGLEVSELVRWVLLGIGGADVAGWVRARFDATTASGWARLGFKPTAAKLWQGGGFDAASAAQWRDSGLSNESAVVWRPVTADPSEALEWFRAGVSPDVAARRRSAGLRPPTV